MDDDPKNIIFDLKKQEIFLELKRLALCDYHYKVSSDLGKDLDVNKVEHELMDRLMITKFNQDYYYVDHYNA